MKKKKGQILAVCGIFIALGIVFGKFLMIPIGNSNRISLGSLPAILASVCFGPVYGFAVGALADVIGCIPAGMAINPLITLGAAAVGCLPGVLCRALRIDARVRSRRTVITLSLGLLVGHAVGDMVLKTAGIFWWYHTPVRLLMLRVPIALATAVLELVILLILFSRRGVTDLLTACGADWNNGKRGNLH